MRPFEAPRLDARRIPPVNDADMDTVPESHLATLQTVYLAADYKWEIDGHWQSLRIGAPAPALEEAFPRARRFGVISAANPGHIMRPDLENRSADRALQRALDQLGLQYRPAFVGAPSRTWKAYNWLAIDPEPTEFDDLARDFGQIGTLLWSRGEPVRLRMRARRPSTIDAHLFVDWIEEDDLPPSDERVSA